MPDPDLTDHFVAEFRGLQAKLKRLEAESRRPSAPATVVVQERRPDERDAQLAALAGRLAEAESRIAQLQQDGESARRQQAAETDRAAALQAELNQLRSTRRDLEGELQQARTEIERRKGVPPTGGGAGNGGPGAGGNRRSSDQDLIESLHLQLQELREENRRLRKTNLKIEKNQRDLQEKLARVEQEPRRLHGGP
jgi:chromosome segregation ATPase